jgi:hypothetical protein
MCYIDNNIETAIIREQMKLFFTKTPTHYRGLNPGPLVS